MITTTVCSAEVSTKDLKAVVSIADRMTRRSPRQHIKNLQISLNGRARISWTNQEFRIQTSIPCDHLGEDLTVIVPAGDLLQVLKGTKAKRLEILPGEGSPEIPEFLFRAGSISRQLSPGTDLRKSVDKKGKETVSHSVPEIPPVDFDGIAVNVPAGEFIQTVKSLSHAVDLESSRYALGGIHCTFSEGVLTMVSTDARRLAIRNIPADGLFTGEFNIPFSALKTFSDLLPKKLVGSLSLIIRERGEEITTNESGKEITIERNGKITLLYADTALESPELQGRFPRWRNVVPACGSNCVIDRLELRELMAELESQCTPESRGIDLKFAADLLVARGNYGSHKIIPVFCPGRVKLTVDPRFVREACDAIDSQEIIFEFNGGENAFVIRSPVPEIHTEVIMPLARDR